MRFLRHLDLITFGHKMKSSGRNETGLNRLSGEMKSTLSPPVLTTLNCPHRIIAAAKQWPIVM